MASTRKSSKAARAKSFLESQENNETAELSADSQEGANEQIARLVDSMRKAVGNVTGEYFTGTRLIWFYSLDTKAP